MKNTRVNRLMLVTSTESGDVTMLADINLLGNDLDKLFKHITGGSMEEFGFDDEAVDNFLSTGTPIVSTKPMYFRDVPKSVFEVSPIPDDSKLIWDKVDEKEDNPYLVFMLVKSPTLVDTDD